ncbi:MAG: hypothetical protein K9K75_02350 [Deltaproteobacteria bacterium]|nr:hypothetical protein [Deltaproteobacteria bacterium]
MKTVHKTVNEDSCTNAPLGLLSSFPHPYSRVRSPRATAKNKMQGNDASIRFRNDFLCYSITHPPQGSHQHNVGCAGAYSGDSKRMDFVADESIQLAITSPPCWQPKDSGIKTQLGFLNTVEGYISNFSFAWRDCARILYPTRRLWINIGDRFFRFFHYRRGKVFPLRSEIVKLSGAMVLGFMGAIIWQKMIPLQGER